MKGSDYYLTNQLGVIVAKGKVNSFDISIDIKELRAGVYLLSVGKYLPQKIVVLKN